MVLSLAFILAFIGASVALVIGILIFSEVTEAMALTLPELFFSTPEVEGLWASAEHCASASCDQDAFEYRIFVQDTDDGVDGAKLRAEANSSTKTQGYLFRSFDKEELDGKLITVELVHDQSNSGKLQLELFDGDFDPVPTGICGTDCFPATFIPDTVASPPIVTSGSGGSLTLFNSACGITGCTTTVRFLSASADLSTFDSPTGKVTLMLHQLESCGSCPARTTIFSVEIEDTGFYNFRNDPQDPTWNGSIASCQRECNTSTSKPSTYYFVTSLPPVIINSDTALNANATFTNALNIGFTVLGVLPVALFFFLFAIFGGRLGDG